MKNKPNQTDFLVKCSVCDDFLDAERMIVLEEKEQKTTVHVTCTKCQSKTMVFLINNQLGMMSVGVATDLDEAEVQNKFNGEVISADEIIDLHQLISNKNDSIMEIIKKSVN